MRHVGTHFPASEIAQQLGKLKAAMGDDAAYLQATIHAQWGNRAKALASLDAAMSLGGSGLELLKTDPDLDPCPRSRASRRSSGS